MQLVMPNMSQQLAIAAFASVLSLTALAFSADGLSVSGQSREGLLPSLAQIPEAPLPTLPAIFPR